MKKTIKAFIALVVICSLSFGQEKIGNKIYLYGDLESSIKGKTLVYYGVDDPKGETKIISKFKKNAVNAISWNKLFIPNYKYTDSTRIAAIEKSKIKTIILIKLNSRSSYTQSYANTTYSSWTDSFNTSISSGTVAGNVGLVFEIYGVEDNFDKPLAVINVNANNSWGVAGSQRGTTLKIMDRVLKSMKKEKAF